MKDLKKALQDIEQAAEASEALTRMSQVPRWDADGIPLEHEYHATGIVEVYRRFKHRMALYESGALHQDFETIGLSPSWLDGLYRKPPGVFFAEQVAFLPTSIAALDVFGSPRILKHAFDKAFLLQNMLRDDGYTDAQVGIFSLPQDAVSFWGPTANFSLVVPSIENPDVSKELYLHSRREKKSYFGAPYPLLQVSKKKLLEIVAYCEKSLATLTKSGHQLAVPFALFVRDLTVIVQSIPQADESISFTRLSAALNHTLSRLFFNSDEFQSGYLWYESSILTSGVQNWERLVRFLLQSGIVKIGDGIARQRYKRDNGIDRFTTFQLADVRPGAVTVLDSKSGQVLNIEQLMLESQEALSSCGECTLFPVSFMNYFSIYGMSNNICLVEGLPYRGARVLSHVLGSGQFGLAEQELTTIGYSALLNRVEDSDRQPLAGFERIYNIAQYYEYCMQASKDTEEVAAVQM